MKSEVLVGLLVFTPIWTAALLAGVATGIVAKKIVKGDEEKRFKLAVAACCITTIAAVKAVPLWGPAWGGVIRSLLN